jgi:hypothetical protein
MFEEKELLVSAIEEKMHSILDELEDLNDLIKLLASYL